MSLNNTCTRWMRENLLLLLILFGVVLGFLIGILLNGKFKDSTDPSPREIEMYLFFPGELFLRMLKLLILPIVVSSLIVSLAILDRKSATKLGKRAAAYFLITSFIGAVLGVLLSTVLKPGITTTFEKKVNEKNGAKATHAILDLFRNILPDNIVEATFSSTATKYMKNVGRYRFVNKSAEDYKTSAKNLSLFLKNAEAINPWSVTRGNTFQVIEAEESEYVYDGLEKYNSANILGILVFTMVFASILRALGEEGKPMTEWFSCLFKVTMKMIKIFMWLSPIGISSLIAGELVAMEDIRSTVQSLGMYIITVTVGCLFHGLVILPSIYFSIVRKNPFLLLSRVSKAILTAFGTGSSSATLPVTLTCLEKNHKADRRVTQFVVPIGATLNMDGMAIYNAVAAIFIYQSQEGAALDLGSSILVCFAATLSSVAAAPFTGSGPIVTKTIVLQVIGVRSADIALILAVDWFLGRIVTPVNVWGDCVGTVIVEHLSREDLLELDQVEGGEEVSDSVPSDCTVDLEIGVAVEIEGENDSEKQNTIASYHNKIEIIDTVM